MSGQGQGQGGQAAQQGQQGGQQVFQQLQQLGVPQQHIQQAQALGLSGAMLSSILGQLVPVILQIVQQLASQQGVQGKQPGQP
jgi:hypothetical protein